MARLSADQVPFLSRLVHERLRRCGGFMVHESEPAALREAARDPPEPAALLVDYTVDNGPVVQASPKYIIRVL